jgi:hypothetical protein
MNRTLNTLVAREHVIDLQWAADRRRKSVIGRNEPPAPPVELRFAGADDADDARRIAALDDAAELEYPVLLAKLDGDPVAAMSLSDGRVVANPFLRTADVVALLRLRAEHLSGDGKPSRRRRLARLRVA